MTVPENRRESIFVFNKQTAYPVDSDMIAKTVCFVLDSEQSAIGEVTVTFVDSDAMCKLNKQYRGIDGATDVLSFSMTETTSVEADPCFANPEAILGDIVICPEIAAGNAVELGHTTEREIVETTIHGLLHLLGYEHDSPSKEAGMLKRQDELAGLINEA